MTTKTSLIKVILSAITIWSILFNSLPVMAQGDIVTSQDISGGSSVFVFRKSTKAAQSKAFARSSTVRNTAQKAESRKSVKKQVALVTPARKKVQKIDTKLIGKTTTKQVRKAGTRKLETITVKVTKNDILSSDLAAKAEAALLANEIEKAIGYFSEAIEKDPTNETLKIGLSEAFTRKGDKQFETQGAAAAMAYYKEAVKVNENNQEALASLGSVYDELNDDVLAVEFYLKALAENSELTELFAPLGIIYAQKGEIAKADEFLTKAIAANPNNEQTLYLLGTIKNKQTNSAEAIKLIEQSIKIKETAEAHNFLGDIYDTQKRDVDAINEYQKAVAINPSFADAWFDLGVLLYNRERYQESIDAYNNAKRLKNDNPTVWLNLADVYRQLQQFDKAIGEYSVGTSLMLNDAELTKKGYKKYSETEKAEIFSKYGYCYGKLNNWDASIDKINTALTYQKDDVDYTNLGWAYFNSAKKVLATTKDQAKTIVLLNLAKDALQQATSRNNNSIGAFMNLGVTLTGLGDFTGAVDALKRANDLKKDWDIGLFELGVAYRQLKDFRYAAQTFKRITELNNKIPEAFYEWGTAENALGNKDAAKSALKKLKEFKTPGAKKLSDDLDMIIKGAVLDAGKRKVESKINQNVPKIPKLPY